MWVVSTDRARCRDCYRCVRECPVKAIAVRSAQAEVVEQVCIACGTCIRACPQDAKRTRDDRTLVKTALSEGKRVVASLAPSFPAFLPVTRVQQLEDLLHDLGFWGVGETAIGAEVVAEAHAQYVAKHPEARPVICSSCPVIVFLIEKHHPELISHLAPIVSPMVAHGRWLKAAYGSDTFTVFIGPCLAKKQEILESEVAGAIDAALTFAELREWLTSEGLSFAPAEEPDVGGEAVAARLFPVEGGLVRTAQMNTDLLATDVITATGIERCLEVLTSIGKHSLNVDMVELMACEGGCINGPAMHGESSLYVARSRVLAFNANRQQPLKRPPAAVPSLTRGYADKVANFPPATEEDVQAVLYRLDKYTPEDELNCGACGYPSCRDKAIATLRGMAELTMCIPYMRRRAESLTNVVIDVTPNAILVVDKGLRVQAISPSAERLFHVRKANVLGKHVSMVVPTLEGFTEACRDWRMINRQHIEYRPDLIVEMTLVPVEGEALLVGVLRDITEEERSRREIQALRAEALTRTQEVIEKQMRVAQEIARLLGETTAETKVNLSRLMQVVRESELLGRNATKPSEKPVSK